MRHLPVIALFALLLVACQPVDDPDLDEDDPGGESPAEPVGAPAHTLPDSLDSLLAELRTTAAQWQADPVVAEVVVELEEGQWTSATVTYLAADADRFLLLRSGQEGTTEERPTLEGFELAPVDAAGVTAIPGPGELLDPDELGEAAAEVLEACGVGEPTSVVYASGAPAAWDGERWTEAPRWRATVAGEAAALIDATSGTPAASDPCLAG